MYKRKFFSLTTDIFVKLIRQRSMKITSSNKSKDNILSHSIVKFDNGYGLSIVKLSNYDNGTICYEVAVIKFNSPDDYIIVYPYFTNNDIVKCNSYHQLEKIILLAKNL